MTAVALRWADDRLGPANLLEGYRAYVDACRSTPGAGAPGSGPRGRSCTAIRT